MGSEEPKKASEQKKQKKFVLKSFEPVKVHGQLYGKTAEFIRSKRHIKFTSEFRDPDFLHYDQIEKMEIIFINRRKLTWIGLCTICIIIGIPILFARAYIPPVKILIYLKKSQKPLKIRARIGTLDAETLLKYCKKDFPTEIISHLRNKDA
jgi:hypothetical protein